MASHGLRSIREQRHCATIIAIARTTRTIVRHCDRDAPDARPNALTHYRRIRNCERRPSGRSRAVATSQKQIRHTLFTSGSTSGTSRSRRQSRSLARNATSRLSHGVSFDIADTRRTRNALATNEKRQESRNRVAADYERLQRPWRETNVTTAHARSCDVSRPIKFARTNDDRRDYRRNEILIT